ncbi:ATP-binding protein [Glaciimonas sp. CA11.2]|uniref:ATP-binding protein n=1 Tax=unclassified Glaciimonas TaxID=2644401 RepID=UPI002AB5D0FC|nr:MULTISPECIES: ATP-binding protein [unclassified Glaciimonas]MDY7545868.1 ATP-binding protein [Glaciimonas sp. CA11.2]MEB0011489.1 ATP-binding protein [Glaciimonas sp. Cout2]MEB0081493.1 ATP-binding protein [Glaciimonas sp. Gout2]MEB0162780.1 ATP-binding protein [Glaciimonas sp. CA11.2]
MDGVKAKLNRSLQFRLSLWLSLTILVMAILAGVFSFISAFREANDLQDDQLRQVAALVDSRGLPLATPTPASVGQMKDDESQVIVQTLGDANSHYPLASGHLALPDNLADGLQTATVNRVPWRLFVRSINTGQRLVVGQQTAVRDEIARDGGLRTVMPLIVLIPLLIGLISLMIRGMLRPITRLSHEVDQRDDQDIRPLDDQHVPDEIRPLIGSINRLLRRVAEAMDAQRRFIADAAHELRSPLTALSLQAENLAATNLSPKSQERLIPLRQGLQRAKNLLEQLLTLARSQNTRGAQATQLSVTAVLRHVMEELLPMAEAKRIDIGVATHTDRDSDLTLVASEVEFVALLRNLLENAIRYTPIDGTIDVRVRTADGALWIEVEDTGPGIAELERERVFDPFYRILGNDSEGSGLGLSIVKSIVLRLQGTVTLQNAHLIAPFGLKVTIRLPV